MAISPKECAEELLETVLLVIQIVYAEVKGCQPPSLSMSQFRALAFLKLLPGASLSDLAEYVGTRPPSTSKMVDGLVERDLVVRQTSATDRRRLTLTLTAQGESVLEAARQGIQARLAEMVTILTDAKRAMVVQAMQTLRSAFGPGSGNEALVVTHPVDGKGERFGQSALRDPS